MPTVSSTVQRQSVWLLQTDRKIVFVRRPTASKEKCSHTEWCNCIFGAEGGIRTLVCFWHKLISSQPRYDRFDTSAYKKHIKFYGILIENCLLTSRKSSLQIPKKQGFSRVYMNRIGTKPSFFRVSPVMTASISLQKYDATAFGFCLTRIIIPQLSCVVKQRVRSFSKYEKY